MVPNENRNIFRSDGWPDSRAESSNSRESTGYAKACRTSAGRKRAWLVVEWREKARTSSLDF